MAPQAEVVVLVADVAEVAVAEAGSAVEGAAKESLVAEAAEVVEVAAEVNWAVVSKEAATPEEVVGAAEAEAMAEGAMVEAVAKWACPPAA